MNKILFTLFIISFVKLSAQNFSGNWGYRINGNEINVYGDKIQNQNNGGSTGTLKIVVYATDYPYGGVHLEAIIYLKVNLSP